jgi:hypothetical protein
MTDRLPFAAEGVRALSSACFGLSRSSDHSRGWQGQGRIPAFPIETPRGLGARRLRRRILGGGAAALPGMAAPTIVHMLEPALDGDLRAERVDRLRAPIWPTCASASTSSTTCGTRRWRRPMASTAPYSADGVAANFAADEQRALLDTTLLYADSAQLRVPPPSSPAKVQPGYLLHYQNPRDSPVRSPFITSTRHPSGRECSVNAAC